MSDYKEILTSDRVYKKYKSIIPDTNVSIDDIIQKLSYFYKISKNSRKIGKKQSFSCPYIIEGQNKNRNRGDYNGKSQPLQLSCRASADDNRNPAVQ